LCSAWAHLIFVSAFRRCHAPRSKRQYVIEVDENLSFELLTSTIRISKNRRGDRECFKDFWEASYATVFVPMGTSQYI